MSITIHLVAVICVIDTGGCNLELLPEPLFTPYIDRRSLPFELNPGRCDTEIEIHRKNMLSEPTVTI